MYKELFTYWVQKGQTISVEEANRRGEVREFQFVILRQDVLTNVNVINIGTSTLAAEQLATVFIEERGTTHSHGQKIRPRLRKEEKGSI